MTTNTTDNSKGMGKYFFRASAQDFNKIPGSPVAYWASDNLRQCFTQGKPLKKIAPAKLGMRTGDNNKWLRRWFEVSRQESKYDATNAEAAKASGKKWFPYNKGGDFRRWYGNYEYIIFWKNDGYAIKQETLQKYPQLTWDNLGWKITNEPDFFKPSCTWTFISSSSFGVRANLGGALFDVAGSSAFPEEDKLWLVTGFLCSRLSFDFLKVSNPTLNFQVANVNSLPWLPPIESNRVSDTVKKLVYSSKGDWDSYETSWDFTTLPLLQPNYRQATLAATYQSLRAHWQENTLEMQRLEEENNRIFIEAYGLEDELTPEVPLEEITLTCNPHYRYRLGKAWDDKSEEERTTELETRLQQDTVKEFISYAVGCMFGRYSLDKEGLVLANQGETLEDYLAQVPNPSFMPDDDNVIPMLDGDWFTDDVVERFKEFLKITFGEEHYETNLAFIEKALNVKGTRNYSIRDYFLKEFYNDHVRTYKKRPIYWLFSSPKGSFNALVYMHRYRPDTVSVVLNSYLREYQTKLKSHKQNLEAISIGGGSQTEKTRALKEIERINKVLHELEEYERDVVYPLATEQVSIDLDDGVKQNYPKLGKALKKITGL